jgi:hypothetical protein
MSHTVIVHEKRIIYHFHLSLFILNAAPQAFIETLRDKMFKPSLSTIVNENTKYCFQSRTDLFKKIFYLILLVIFLFLHLGLQ